MVLCNQGCHTHIYIKDGAPYNAIDDTPHRCPVLEMAKMWGGFYDTIPMGYIRNQIIAVFEESSRANQSRNIDDILKALQTTVDKLQYVMYRMESKAVENKEYADKLEDYKTQLVKDQERREREKHNKDDPKFVTADKL